jgi:putative copper resistance protein D
MDNFLFLPRALAAALSDAAFAAAVGLVIASLWLQRDNEQIVRASLRRGVILSTAAMLVALSAQAYLLTATMVGSPAFRAIRSQSTAVMTGTHAGRVLLCNCALSLTLLILLSLRKMWRTRFGTYSLLAMLVILAATRAATGHPAADGDFTLPEFVQFVHLISIAIWSGGVIATGFVVLPALLRSGRIQVMLEFTRQLSNTVTIALLLIVVSGVYNSYRGLGGSLAPLAGTQWGILLDVKLMLVCVALSMGALNRRMLRTDRGLSTPQASRLALSLRGEAAVMLLILTVSALLANSPPANPL